MPNALLRCTEICGAGWQSLLDTPFTWIARAFPGVIVGLVALELVAAFSHTLLKCPLMPQELQMFLRTGHYFRSRWVDPPQYRHLARGADGGCDGGCDLAILICVCVCTEVAGDESSLALTLLHKSMAS